MPKRKQPIYLAITPKGNQYFQQMVAVGYLNISMHQKTEWDILHDLILRGEPIAMSTFLTEGRDSILGRAFASLSERPHGQLVIDHYGKTLHSLIKQGHVRAFKKLPEEPKL